jgi:uncharacterized membrane protein
VEPYSWGVTNSWFKSWQANFWAGLVIIFPAVISIAVVVWLFGTVANITDTLLFFLPRKLTHKGQGDGPMYWYWSLVALALAVFLVALVGRAARNYFGKKIIEWVDATLLRVPLLSKLYGAIKQVNEALSLSNKTAFRTVALVPFPHPECYSIGFITNEQLDEFRARTERKVVCVFVPTTPNPTSGFLVLVPEEKVIRLSLPVADAVKYIISLGSITPEYAPSSPLTQGQTPAPVPPPGP